MTRELEPFEGQRVLSLSQPWAWLVLFGGKDVENRTWNTKHRGRFIVHATARFNREVYDRALELASGIDPAVAEAFPKPEALAVGGIIGSVDLWDVIAPIDDGSGARTSPHRWHFADQYGFRLAQPRPLPFVACSGQLNFWLWPPKPRPRKAV